MRIRLFWAAKNISDCSLDYHYDLTVERFEEWFPNQGLPNILAVWWDNASEHGRPLNKIPSFSNRKKVNTRRFVGTN